MVASVTDKVSSGCIDVCWLFGGVMRIRLRFPVAPSERIDRAPNAGRSAVQDVGIRGRGGASRGNGRGPPLRSWVDDIGADWRLRKRHIRSCCPSFLETLVRTAICAGSSVRSPMGAPSRGRARLERATSGHVTIPPLRKGFGQHGRKGWPPVVGCQLRTLPLTPQSGNSGGEGGSDGRWRMTVEGWGSALRQAHGG